ncbi:hypothetical protein [Chengkuizengella sediminis]|nr:hypothetical protein [Chengkuizengella sediminis]NDI36048.1 hypothetical protein [Chengkuizengella sediminis]
MIWLLLFVIIPIVVMFCIALYSDKKNNYQTKPPDASSQWFDPPDGKF